MTEPHKNAPLRNPADLLHRAERALNRGDLDTGLALYTQALDLMLEEWPDIAEHSQTYRNARAHQVQLESDLAALIAGDAA